MQRSRWGPTPRGSIQGPELSLRTKKNERKKTQKRPPAQARGLINSTPSRPRPRTLRPSPADFYAGLLGFHFTFCRNRAGSSAPLAASSRQPVRSQRAAPSRHLGSRPSDAGITAVPVLVARPEHIEELLDHVVIAQRAAAEPARIQFTTLRQRDVFSTTPRRSFALGSVVTISSCLISQPPYSQTSPAGGRYRG